MLEFLEVIGYFLGFWLFILSQKFRQQIIDNWHKSGWPGKLNIFFGAATSTFCGVILPILIITPILSR